MSDRRHGLQRQLLSFVIVGGVGFVIDAALLTALSVTLGFNVYASRAVSFGVASLATWALNRRHTFQSGKLAGVAAGGSEYARYMTIQVCGAVINLGVFSILVAIRPELAAVPALPLAVGSGIAMFFTFFANRNWLYRSSRTSS